MVRRSFGFGFEVDGVLRWLRWDLRLSLGILMEKERFLDCEKGFWLYIDGFVESKHTNIKLIKSRIPKFININNLAYLIKSQHLAIIY